MSFIGIVNEWNDERGFGFIRPEAGGQDIFVHIRSFEGQTARPAVGQRVSFEVETGIDGKKRAKRVLPARFAARYKPERQVESPKFDAVGLLVIGLFAALYWFATTFWRIPHVVGTLYLAASVVCFAAYARDKSAAKTRRWRTPEGTLLMLGFLGGWPGAILAQQLFRHKSTKASFQAKFWASVIVNAAGFIAFASPLLASIVGKN